jgi:hypothetical protein
VSQRLRQDDDLEDDEPRGCRRAEPVVRDGEKGLKLEEAGIVTGYPTWRLVEAC